MLRGLPGGARWTPALEASEQAIHGEDLTGDAKPRNCRFLRRETLQPLRTAGDWPGRPGQIPPPAVSLSRPLLTKRNIPQLVERVFEDRLRRVRPSTDPRGLVEGTRRPLASATGTDHQRDAGPQLLKGPVSGAGQLEAPLLALCAWSGMRVVERAASHKARKSIRGPREGSKSRCSSGAGSAPAAVPGGQLLCRPGSIEGQETNKNTNMRKSKQPKTQETIIKRPGNVPPGHPSIPGSLLLFSIVTVF